MVLVLLTAAGWHWQTGKYLKEPLSCCSEEWRKKLEEPISEVQPDKRYLLCIPEDYYGWPKHIWRYHLQTDFVDSLVVTDESQMLLAENYDYMVIWDLHNSIIETWVQTHYPDAAGSKVVPMFS
jgi:hypothetical protein